MPRGYILRQAEIKGSPLKWQVFRKVSHAESSRTFYVISRSFLKLSCRQTSGERVANRFGINILNVVLSGLTKQLNPETNPKKNSSSLYFCYQKLFSTYSLRHVIHTKGKKRSIFCIISCLTTHSVIHHKKDKQGTKLKFTWKPTNNPLFR